MKSKVKTMPPSDPLEPEGALAALKRDIVSGVLAPGAPLRLMALSKRYGVGYTPLREALSRLEEAGLAVLSPNRGYRVASVSVAELEDLEQARAVVETALLKDAIAHGDLEWESAIVACHHRLARASAALCSDRAAAFVSWMDAHDAFHGSLLAAARSGWLKSFQRQISEQLRRHHQALLFAPDGDVEREAEHDAPTLALLEEALSLANHTRLMEAALARDAVRAAALLREHVQFTLAVYRSAAARPGGGPPLQA
ncbi:GntR family transcriptional regulator [Nitratireductor rhodophyticola]|uniref:GntR family transcriptional regulator n=1 Tax=Nitratireductor rhodophyticola TaxID=2854036 RepID=UPI002AC8C8EC|nr:GntR family transcriptional regulator [Nitratireductor rhodophyticola]MEC9244161.1 GntR family transcriptional regulator [Pseudomonadota bacterium]WPZ12604.1 GntR family transcriptional regulator [Nitratireductor rhodophyticola]